MNTEKTNLENENTALIKGDVSRSKINNYYPFVLRSHAYEKLFAIQTIPETKYWFKDEEVTIEKLIHI